MKVYIQVVLVQESNIQQLIPPVRWRLVVDLTEHPKKSPYKIHLVFLIYSDYANTDTPKSSIRNDGQKESFSVELFIIVCYRIRKSLDGGDGDDDDEIYTSWKYLHYEFKIQFAAFIYNFPTLVMRFSLREGCHMSCDHETNVGFSFTRKLSVC